MTSKLFTGNVNVRRALCILCAATMALLGHANGQITSMNSDRHFIVGARALSLADAYVAEPFDAVSMYTNPATLTWLLRKSVTLNYSLERILSTDNIMNENIAFPIPISPDVCLGIGGTLSHVGHIRRDSPLSGYNYRQYGLDLGIAWSISKFVSLGGGVSARRGVTDGTALSSILGTVGALYSPSPDLSYGISVQGWGNGLSYSLDPGSEKTLISRENLLKSLQFGVAWHYRNRPTDAQPIVTVVTANQKIFTVKGVVYKGGIEYIPFTIIAFRVGYWLGPDTRVAKVGFGVFLSRLELDYAASPSEFEPVTHQVSISYALGE